MQIEVVEGDITKIAVDAIVNAANSSLLGGGGVDGAIHRAAGPALLKECRRVRERLGGSGLPAGQAVATGAGDLPARWVIHTVGPVYAGVADPAKLLASCYTESLRIAEELGATSIAFPAISTGVYGYPIEEAAEVAADAVENSGSRVERVQLVCFDPHTAEYLRSALGRRNPDPSKGVG